MRPYSNTSSTISFDAEFFRPLFLANVSNFIYSFIVITKNGGDAFRDPPRHHFPQPTSVQGEECQYFMHLLLCHYLQISTFRLHNNKILCFCVDILHCIIAERFGGGEWVSDMVQFLVGNTYTPLILVPSKDFETRGLHSSYLPMFLQVLKIFG